MMFFSLGSNMSNDIAIEIYYGPLSWFNEQLGDKEYESLLDVANERDEAGRRHTHVMEGQEAPEPSPMPRPERVVGESSDYASLNEHVINNFMGLVRSVNPERLYLHNPPASISTQLERYTSPEVKRYNYPPVTRDVLVRFRNGFHAHLIGQNNVRERLLAALYPLTTTRRERPVVVMFYGPSGVGKTETAQFVNSLLGGELMRKQFSMFHSDKFAAYLFGGTHSEASFAHDLLDRESGVILIDEFDKANPVFHGAFYQLFDNGIFEDKNYSVALGPSLIICTSNYSSESEMREALGDALFSRFDSLIRFEQLSVDEIKLVIDRLVDARFNELAADEQKVLSPDAVKAMLHPIADKFGNVRKLGKLADEVISLQLVRVLLAENESSVAIDEALDEVAPDPENPARS